MEILEASVIEIKDICPDFPTELKTMSIFLGPWI